MNAGDIVCRGSWSLGAACGACTRCRETAPQEVERLIQRVRDVEHEKELLEARRRADADRFGTDSPSGDLLHWLCAVVENPENGANRAVVELFVARESGEPLAKVRANLWRKAKE